MSRTVPRAISEIMTKRVLTAQPTTILLEAAKTMYEKRVGSLVVVSSNNKLVGIITRSDLTRAISLGADPRTVKVEEFMSSPVITALPEATILEVSKVMYENKIHHVPIVNIAGELVGIIASYDLTFYRIFHLV